MRLDASYKALIILALSSFCMGVTEFVMAGVLQDVALYFHTDTANAGWLTTLYAVGVVVGAPLVTIPLSPLNRKYQLLINLGVFGLANLVIYFSSNFYLTAFARFIAGTQHGVFFLIATVMAVQVAKAGKESQALSLMVSGLTIALVSGVPLGSFIGNAFGFKMVFLLIFVCVACAFIAAVLFLPNLPSQRMKFGYIAKVIVIKPLLQSYIVTLSACGAGMVIYTYVADLLVHVTHFSKEELPVVLLAYGFFGIIGNLVGGKLADRRGAIVSLRIITTSQMIIYALLTFSMYWKIPVVIHLCLIGFIGFACIAPLKVLAMLCAKKYADAYPDSAVSLNEAAFNVGIAFASFVGGITLKHLGVTFNPIVAAAFVLPACLIVWLKRDV